MKEHRPAGNMPVEENGRTGKQVTKEVLLSLLRAVLTGGAMPSFTLTPELFSFCASQQLIGFLHHAVRHPETVQCSPETAERVKKSYAFSIAQQIQQDYYREQIFSALSAAGIPYLPLKGEDLRAVYPSPDLRFSCDVDFFYPKEHRARVHGILTGLGFRKDKTEPHNDSYIMGVVHIEPHFSLSDGDERSDEYYADIPSRLRSDDGVRYRFTDEEGYIYILLHAYKHFLSGGAGIRSVLDTWLWKKMHPAMDENALAVAYDALGIARFAAQYEHLGRVWLTGAPCDEDAAILTAYLFAGGAYGTLEQGALMGLATDERRFVRLSYCLRRIFLPYRLLRLQYPILRKAPILYPFCTVLRWFRVIFSKNRKNVRRDLAVAEGLSREKADVVRRVWDIIR